MERERTRGSVRKARREESTKGMGLHCNQRDQELEVIKKSTKMNGRGAGTGNEALQASKRIN